MTRSKKISSEECEKVKKQCVKAQCVLKSKVDVLEVNELFVGGKPLKNDEVYIINDSTVFVGDNPASISPCLLEPFGPCLVEPSVATPGTPSGGVFKLGRSFSGKITFYGIKGIELNLAGYVLNNDDDVALEFINCTQVWVHGGSVNSVNNHAIKICSSSNLCISRINTSDTSYGIYVQSSYDVNLKNWYFERITGYVMKFECTNYIRVSNITIKEIRGYDGDFRISEDPRDSLFIANNSQMIFVNNCSIFDIEIRQARGVKNILAGNNCFDVKLSRISILTTTFTGLLADQAQDLSVYLIYFTNSGSINMNSLVLNGDYVEVFGNVKAVFNCVRFENCNNTFIDDIMATDNTIYGAVSNGELRLATVYIDSMETFILEHSRICTNSIYVTTTATSNPDLVVHLSSFHGTSSNPPFLNGNWYLNDNVSNQNRLFSSAQIEKSAVYGYLIEKLDKAFVIEDCSSNNHGYDLTLNVQVTKSQLLTKNSTLQLKSVEHLPKTGTLLVHTDKGFQKVRYSGIKNSNLLNVTTQIPFQAKAGTIVSLEDPLRGPKYVAGISISSNQVGLETTIMADNSSANNNISDLETGTTVGMISTYNNTILNDCEAVGNRAGRLCAGFMVTGSNVLVNESQVNSNTASNFAGYGLYAAELLPEAFQRTLTYQLADTKLNNLTIEETIFNSNSECGVYVTKGINVSLVRNTFNSNRCGVHVVEGIYLIEDNMVLNNEFGLKLENVSNTSIEENNVQNCTTHGIEIVDSENTSLIRNTCKNNQDVGFYINGGSALIEDNLSLGNNQGYRLEGVSNSTIQQNLAQNNNDGYLDDSSTNSYFTNKAIKNTVTSFENVVSKFSWFDFNPDGSFTLNPLSGPSTLSAFSNISAKI